jgi:hypothetical protein
MDYELRIKMLEVEATHLKEMQALQRARQDTSDDRHATAERLILESLEMSHRHDAEIAVIRELLADTGRKLDQLTDAILREHSNGRTKT